MKGNSFTGANYFFIRNRYDLSLLLHVATSFVEDFSIILKFTLMVKDLFFAVALEVNTFVALVNSLCEDLESALKKSIKRMLRFSVTIHNTVN